MITDPGSRGCCKRQEQVAAELAETGAGSLSANYADYTNFDTHGIRYIQYWPNVKMGELKHIE